MSIVRRGDVWLADLDPTRGREQSGRRPVLVVSVDRFNASKMRLVMTVPFTARQRGAPNHVEVKPPDGGLNTVSFAMCEQLRSIAIERLLGRPLGQVSSTTMDEVTYRLQAFLGIEAG